MKTISALSAALALSAACGSDAPCSGTDEDGYPNQKICRGFCALDIDTPEICGSGAACHSCPPTDGAHTRPSCSGGLCGSLCQSGFADCNHLAADGCEVSLSDDANNCGACGALCKGQCIAGLCSAKWEGESNPSGIAASQQAVFWTAMSGATLELRQGLRDGSGPLTLASVPTGPGVPASLVIHETELFFATGSQLMPGSEGGAIYRYSLMDRQLSLLATDQDAPGALLATDTALYWTNAGGGQVMRAARPFLSPATALATGQPRPGDLTLDDTSVYWVNQGAADGGGAVMAALLDGGGPPLLVSTDAALPDGGTTATAATPGGIATASYFVNETSTTDRSIGFTICWGDRNTGRVWASNKAGPPFAFTVPQAAWDPQQLFGSLEGLRVGSVATGSFYVLGELYVPNSFVGEYRPPFSLYRLRETGAPTTFSENGSAYIKGDTIYSTP